MFLVGGAGPAASAGSVLSALLAVERVIAARPMSAAFVGGDGALATPITVVYKGQLI